MLSRMDQYFHTHPKVSFTSISTQFLVVLINFFSNFKEQHGRDLQEALQGAHVVRSRRREPKHERLI